MVEIRNGAFNAKLHRDLNVTRKSARFPARRIHEFFEAATAVFSGPAEIGGTCIGGKRRNMPPARPSGGGSGPTALLARGHGPDGPRSASAVCVLRLAGRSSVRNIIPFACRSALFTATNRIVGRDAVSQTASGRAAAENQSAL